MDKELDLGLGEARDRIDHLRSRKRMGIATEEEKEEYKLLNEALNSIRIKVNMVCELPQDEDGLALFTKSAKTSCCRPQTRLVSTNRTSRGSRG